MAEGEPRKASWTLIQKGLGHQTRELRLHSIDNGESSRGFKQESPGHIGVFQKVRLRQPAWRTLWRNMTGGQAHWSGIMWHLGSGDGDCLPRSLVGKVGRHWKR